tara:strand:+ start:54 stop:1733 length:1680 start_codon:yes stop_codon:yes gene_type:complete
MPLTTPRSIRRHFDRLKSDRGRWEFLWQDIADYGIGRRLFTRQPTATGEGNRTYRIYNNTMMVANDLLASGLHNLLTSTANRWFHLEPDNQMLLELPEVADWFSTAEDILFSLVERPEAGFHPQVHEVYNDIAAFGNGSLTTLRAPGEGIFFQAMPLMETYIDEGPDGRINMIFRHWRYNALQIQQRYGEGAYEPADKAIAGDDLARQFWLLQAFIPNEVFDYEKSFGPQASQVKAVTLDYEGMKEIETTYFREMPIAFARWNKDPGELYARGPGVQALSDQRMLNEMQKTTLEGAQKAVNPPLMVPDNGFITQMDMSPAGLTVYRAGTPDPVRELYTGRSMGTDLGMQMIQGVQTNVRAAYHYEMLQLLQDPRMSATQVLELSSRSQQILSPVIGRIQAELLEPVIERSFNLAMRMGAMPPVPEILAGERLNIRYVSPIQRAQRAGEAQALLQAMNSVIQLAQLDQTALDSLDSDKITRFLFEAWGVPPDLLRSEDLVEEMRTQRAQMAAQQEQQETLMEGAKAAAPLLSAAGGVEGLGGLLGGPGGVGGQGEGPGVQ